MGHNDRSSEILEKSLSNNDRKTGFKKKFFIFDQRNIIGTNKSLLLGCASRCMFDNNSAYTLCSGNGKVKNRDNFRVPRQAWQLFVLYIDINVIAFSGEGK